MGLCIDDNGNAFIPDPTGSPALTALQGVLKAGIMAGIAVFAGPVVAVYNIAVSNFQILSRLEMVSGRAIRMKSRCPLCDLPLQRARVVSKPAVRQMRCFSRLKICHMTGAFLVCVCRLSLMLSKG